MTERYHAHFPLNSEQNRTMYVDVFKEDRAMLDSKSSALTKCFSYGKVGHLKRDCQAATPVRSSNNTGTKKKSDVCYYYNHFKKPNRLIQAGGISKCNNKIHKCSTCSDAKCASYKHRQEAQLNSVSSSIDTSDVQNQITTTINAGFEKLVSHLSSQIATSCGARLSRGEYISRYPQLLFCFSVQPRACQTQENTRLLNGLNYLPQSPFMLLARMLGYRV